jgi:hypothetical protein
MTHDPPPVVTLTEELLGWTLDRSAAIPKSQRHTFGQRLDSLMLCLLERMVVARFDPQARAAELRAANLEIEILRTLWRIVQARGWISQRQLFFVTSKLDEIGRMAGAWRKTIGGKIGP